MMKARNKKHKLVAYMGIDMRMDRGMNTHSNIFASPLIYLHL